MEKRRVRRLQKRLNSDVTIIQIGLCDERCDDFLMIKLARGEALIELVDVDGLVKFYIYGVGVQKAV